MNPGLETIGVILLAAMGGALGIYFSRCPRPWWVVGYVVSLGLVVLMGVCHRCDTLQFTPPFSWLMAGRTEFALTAPVAAMLLLIPLSRLPRRRDRVGVCILLGIVVTHFTVLPFLAPALNRGYLASLQTVVDSSGICLQSNDYNCGPAAAVTAIRMLGLPAEEGELAILARSSQFTGTETDVLRDALHERYAGDGVRAEYRFFKSLEELRGRLTIARIKAGLLLDHYVTVLDVTDIQVVVGDPSRGLRQLSHAEFEAIWRFTGITLER